MTAVFSVSQINRYIKDLVRKDVMLSSVFVRGEISNLKYHPRGHIYFSLKDKGGTISAVMFASHVRNLPFRLHDGDTVIAAGYVDVYEEGGKYQLYVRQIRPDGIGELYEKFLALKQKLQESGMFDDRYKMPVPRYATKIGVVTASSGAAVRDIERVTALRNPYVQLFLYPAQVQGKGAASDIAEGIRVLDGMGLDLIIVGRGGGSIEDLWAFNEEEVAYAIFNCATPVITGIGHQTDTTIADFVADLRAPTPSAAAESAVFEIRAFFEKTDKYALRLRTPVERTLSVYRERLARYRNIMRYNSPERKIADMRMHASDLEERMTEALLERIKGDSRRGDEMRQRLAQGMKNTYDRTDRRLIMCIERMHGLSPLRRLRQGFSFTEDGTGRPVRSIGAVKTGDSISVYVSDGKLLGEVTGTEKAFYIDEEKG